MEDLKAMLNFDNTSVQFKVVKKLVQKIAESTSKGQPISAENSKKPLELDFLLENCCSSNAAISHNSCEAVHYLVVHGHIDWKFAVTQLLGVLYSSEHVSAIILIIGKLLFTQMRGEIQAGAKYKCPFGLRNPTHPFVLILREKPDSWIFLLESMELCFKDHQGWETFEMFSPVFTYAILNPGWSTKHAMLRSKLFHKVSNLPTCPRHVHFLKCALQWLPLQTEQELSHVVLVLEECLPTLVGHNTALQSWVCALGISVAYEAWKLQVNSLPLLQILSKVFGGLKECDFLTDVCFVELAVCLTRVPSTYLSKLFDICDTLLDNARPSPTVASILLLPLVQIFTHPPDSFDPKNQQTKLQASAVKLLGKVESICYNSASGGSARLSLKKHIIEAAISIATLSGATYDAVLVAKVLHEFDNIQSITDKHRYIEAIGSGVASKKQKPELLVVLLASALIATADDMNILQSALDIAMNTATRTKDLGPLLFSVVLYKLSKSTNPDFIMALLYALPQTAVHKYCIPPLHNTLQALSVNPTLKACCIVCFTELYKRQPQCFPLLLKAIGEEEIDGYCDDVLLSKASAILNVIKHDCSLHGVDVLPFLSAIINKYKNHHQTAAVVLALRGISELCKAEVIDIRSTLDAVMPKLWRDERPLVLTALYQLISVVPQLSVPSLEYEKYEKELLSKLWKVVIRGSNDVTTGGAYRALAEFPTNYHSLKVIPPEAKKNLKIPISKASTPLELAQNPEDVLPYTPGYCFIDLLQSIESEDVLDDYTYFLSQLLVKEVKEMPRSAYSLSQMKYRDTSKDQQRRVVPQLLQTLYETNKYPGVQSSIAVGVLLTSEPPVQLDREGKPLKKSLAEQCKFYERLISTLLQDVPLDANDWYRTLLATSAWSMFMRRAFHAAEESRRVELEHLRSHGKLPGSAEDVTRQFNRSWLWARDSLTEAIKKNCFGRATQQANALLALSALLVTVSEYHSGLDIALKQSAADDTTHIPPSEWTKAVLDLIISCIDSDYGHAVKMFDWIFKSSTKSTSGGSTLLRSCASVSASWVVPYLHQKDPKLVPSLLEKLMNQLALESSKPAQLLLGIGLGFFIQATSREGLLESTRESGGTKGLVKYIVKNLMSSCFDNGDTEPKAGDLLCLTLCLSGLSQSRDEEMRNLVLVACAKFCEVLHAMDSRMCSFEVHCVCTAVLICNAASTLLTMDNVEELLLWFEKRRQENAQCVGTSVSLGILVCMLQEMNHPKAEILYRSLHSHWISILGSESQPTLSRLAAIKGLCIMSSGGRLLLMVNAKEQSSERGLKEVFDLLLNMMKVSKDTGLLSCTAWLLGELHIVNSGQSQNTSSVPSSYAYLGEQSILWPLTNFVATSIKSGSMDVHLQACIKALKHEFPRALPPFNWTALLTPLMTAEDAPALPPLVISVALQNSSSSASMCAFLTTCVSEPLLHSLTPECVNMLLSSIPMVAKVVPPANLKPFLKLVTIRGKASTTDMEAIVKGMIKVLNIADLPSATTSLVNAAIVEIFGKAQQLFSACLESGLMSVLCECFLLLSEMCQDGILDSLTNIPMVIYLHTRLCVKGRRPINATCNPFKAACSIPQGERLDILKLLLRCLEFDDGENCTQEVIRWFVDCLMMVKETAEQTAPNILFLQYQLQLVSLVATALSRLHIQHNLIHHHDLPSTLLLLLPKALVSLLSSPKWNGIVQVVFDWLLHLLDKPRLHDLKPQLLGCICNLRSTEEYKSSMWVQSVSHITQ
ncbi:focadhesin-like [Ornithodoros turicata]|uniref:focadhesin-like n=1 Tax=Ornithodoros turicata TaxID=34597 RepID=UPI0031395668